ncbi:MAG: hypothetical protein FWH24_04430 [Oscillospiraceae bacterium]|nr:hypothetical protein [Oscillospiraceae bacterium]
MNQRKSLLPLIEIIISAGIFAIAAVLTLQMFMTARFLGYRTSDTADAVLKVQHIAETIKSFENSGEISGFLEENTRVYYDADWQRTENADEAVYTAEINTEALIFEENYEGSLYIGCTISLYKITPYPFINDKTVQSNPDYRPLLASVNAGKFVKE